MEGSKSKIAVPFYFIYFVNDVTQQTLNVQW